MKATVSRMQGTPASIEFHYEALAYCKREKRICHFERYGVCENNMSSHYKKRCLGYNECSEFTSEDRFCDKVGRSRREKQRREKIEEKRAQKNSSMTTDKGKCKKEPAALPQNALGNDPRFASLFAELRQDD